MTNTYFVFSQVIFEETNNKLLLQHPINLNKIKLYSLSFYKRK